MLHQLFPTQERLSEGTVLLRGFVLHEAEPLVEQVRHILKQAPLRHLTIPGGFTMSVSMSNCGALGWTSSTKGYRYSAVDPDNGAPWPAIPPLLNRLATEAADRAGYRDFQADACLINSYSPGARLSLHQDKDEQDLSAPIVSCSLGLPAIFLWGGLSRKEKTRRLLLEHGDVLVWGGPDRLRYHGIAPLARGNHPLLGETRINLTFRKVL